MNDTDTMTLDKIVKEYKGLYKNVQGSSLFINDHGLYCLLCASGMGAAKKILEPLS